MKKPNLIIGKKQIILACLTLILGVAVYINYAMSQSDGMMQPTDAGVSTDNDKAENQPENYGDTKFVNGEEVLGKAGVDESTSEVAIDENTNAKAEVDSEESVATDESGTAVEEDLKASNMSSDEYFAQARLEKMNSRDNAVQTLQSIIGGGDLSEDEMVTKQLEAVELSQMVEKEGNIESLIKTQGFEDCVVYLDGNGAKVVVKSEGLTKGQVASIKDIILGEVSVKSENIRIFEVK